MKELKQLKRLPLYLQEEQDHKQIILDSSLIPNSSKEILGKEIKSRKVDLNFLKKVVSIQSSSNTKLHQKGDLFMRGFIISSLYELSKKYDNIEAYVDDFGNIYVIKGKAESYPAVVSHIDTVHSEVKDYRVHQQGDILFAFSADKKSQVGIGGDDKVGVFTCLQSLVDFDNIKVVFYRDEEIGCLGSRYSIKNHIDFYNNCNFVLECDRRGTTDFITKSGGIQICSDDFSKACEPFKQEHGFKDTVGISTDVDKLVSNNIGISCVNIASAYFNPHTSSETISVSGVGCSYSLMYDIIKNLGDTKFPFEYKPLIFFNKYVNNKNNRKNNSTYHFPLSDIRPYISKAPLVEDLYNIEFLTFNISTAHKCDYCGSTYNYDTVNEVFSCDKCSTETYEKSMFKDVKLRLTVEGKLKEYYFSWVYNGWVLCNKALWNNKFKTYVPRKHYIEEWDLK